MRKSSTAVIVLNWNDADLLASSIGSLLKQSAACDIIVVDNGSVDNSKAVIESFGTKIIPLWNKRNLGFAGGVNTGIRYALTKGYTYIGLLNNDAEAEKNWLKHLLGELGSNKVLGGVTCAMLHKGDDTYDSTGDFYTRWGLPFPRGRGEPVRGQYDKATEVTAISGGASLFRAEFFKDVGLFDEDFFAYYEDVDLGIRGQLKGWKFQFVPEAKVLHATGSTSSRVKGFTTYQTFKNFPWIIWKNVPLRFLLPVFGRFSFAYAGFFMSALQRGQLRFALKGMAVSLLLLPKKLFQRYAIQRSKRVDTKYVSRLLLRDLPPNAAKLRRLRAIYWKLTRKQTS